MHFIRAGQSAPPILFVHGFACTHEDWKFQLDFFSKTNEVVACDLRGHGKTPGRPSECSIEHYGGDVAALVNNLELKGVVLVGHSMGCRVVLEVRGWSRRGFPRWSSSTAAATPRATLTWPSETRAPP